MSRFLMVALPRRLDECNRYATDFGERLRCLRSRLRVRSLTFPSHLNADWCRFVTT